eukprot:TRINITY_DN128310_c0_g1_i1.p1 TRINITY_DN128310_c0_g1~~TRINITY_DN128310_c0_g1_i1.p1  ORF type:complete len:214 (+),score=53.30 TRINITY_DN128310_c0_g1_i1:31-672(+)
MSGEQSWDEDLGDKFDAIGSENRGIGSDFRIAPEALGLGINIDPAKSGVGSLFGVVDQDFIQTDARKWHERMFYRTGTLYLSGIVSGGIYGFVRGVRRAPNKRFKIKINNILNASGRKGADVGNCVGAAVLMYCFSRHLVDKVITDEHFVMPEFARASTAGFLTGLGYKSLAGPRGAIVAGILGASLMGSLTFVNTYVCSKFKFARSVSRMFN